MPESPRLQTDPVKPVRGKVRSKGSRAVVSLVLTVVLAVVASRMDLRPSLSHVDLAVLGGAKQGHYQEILDEVKVAAEKRKGRIVGVETMGSVENVGRLSAAKEKCTERVALSQAGLSFPPGTRLLGRLTRMESIFFLGKKADEITEFSQLAHLKVGAGPEGGGTALILHQIFDAPDMKELGVTLSNHDVMSQLELAEKGDLDLAAFVMDEDSSLIKQAVHDRGLQIAGFGHADVIARQYRFLKHGRIGAGQYDPLRMLPKADKHVLRVETLVIENGCASRSQIMGLLSTLADVFPDFTRYNRETPNTSGLELAPAAKNYWENGGPDLLDVYLPRVADVMPTNNWVHLIMGISVLFNIMGVANRFALWRIDAARVRAEHEIGDCFGPAVTLGDIGRIEPDSEKLMSDQLGGEIDRVILELEDLAQRCRKISLSVLVPMGSEMAYRYQETLIHDTLSVLRAFRDRWMRARKKRSDAAQ